MACDMIDSCIKRTDVSFQNHLKKGILLNPTDYIVPTEICAMINVVLDAKNQSFKLCAVDGVDVHKYHTKIDDLIEKTLVTMKSGLVMKLTSVLKSVMEKLSRYDEGTVFGSILGAMNKNNLTGTGTDLGKSYMSFCRGNMDQIEKKIKDDLWVTTTFERWYAEQVQMLCTWLTDRLDRSLHHYQCTCLTHIVKKLYGEFELMGVPENKLNSQHWQNVEQRMQTEEAACVLTGAEAEENGEIYEEEDEGDGGPGGKNPAAAAKEMKDALASGGVDAVADMGGKAAAKMGGMMAKGVGGLAGKAFGSFW